MPSIAKKKLWRKIHIKFFLSSFQNNISLQTVGSVFADRCEQTEKNKLELKLIKRGDCLLDCHGNYISNLVYFKISLL